MWNGEHNQQLASCTAECKAAQRKECHCAWERSTHLTCVFLGALACSLWCGRVLWRNVDQELCYVVEAVMEEASPIVLRFGCMLLILR